jgi:hypothetical protein
MASQRSRFHTDGTAWADVAFSDSAIEGAVLDAAGHPLDSAAITNVSRPQDDVAPTQIVFIEGNVPDAQDLLAGVQQGVQAVLLDPAQDGVQQIAAYLASHDIQGLAGIDIVAHGADGEIALGTGTLSSATLADYQSQLQQIGAALAPGGAIQLYGCDVAEDATGVAFLDQLSQATGGASIAAASHLVGDAAGGGSFNLNVNVGTIDASVPFTTDALTSFRGELSLSTAVPQLYVVWSADANSPTTITRVEQVGISGTTFVAGSSIDLADASTLDLNQLRGVAFDAPLGRYFFDQAVDQSNLNSAMLFEGTIGSPAAPGTINISASSSIFYTGLAFDPLANKVYMGEQVYAGLTSGSTTPMTSTIDGIGIYSFTPSANIAAAVTPTMVIYGHSTIAGGGTLQGPSDVVVVPNTNLLIFTDDQEIFLGNGSAHIDVGNVLSHQWSTLAIPGSIISTAVDGAAALSVAVDATSATGGILFFAVEDGTTANNGIFSVGYTITGSGASQSASLSSTITPLYTGVTADFPTGIVINPIVTNGTVTGNGTLYTSSANGTIYAGNMAGGGALIAVGDLSGGSSAAESLVYESLPGITPGSGITYTQGSTVALNGGLVVVNTDNQELVSATVTVPVSDTLHYTTTLGISGSFSSGTLTLTGTTTAANYQAALDSITFSSTAAAGTQTVNWAASDGVVIGTATSNITIASSGPTLSAGGTVTFSGGGSPVALDATAAITDGSNITGATIDINTGRISGDTLNYTPIDGITVVSNANGTLILGGTATAADYTAALDSITYSITPTNGDPTGGGTDNARTVSWKVIDASGSATATSTLAVVHVAPTVTAGATTTFFGGGGAVVLDSGLAVSDVDSGGVLSSATVTIAGAITGDTLNFTNTNATTEGNIAVASDSGGVLTLTSSGSTATLAQWQTALESVTYSFTPSNGDPSDGGADPSRTIDWVVNDGVASSAIATSTLDTKESTSAITYGTTIDETGIVAVTETVTAGVMTLKNAGGTSVGSITVGTSLNSGDFILKPDSGSGTDVIENTVFGTYASGVTLLTNPTTIAATGKVSNTVANGKAVSGPSGTNWTLTNFGKVSETDGIGVSFALSGTVTNASGGTITAMNQAVDLTQGGVVTNAAGGFIYGGQGVYAHTGAVTVTNAGSIGGSLTTGDGIVAEAGGQVTNQSGGTISGYFGILGINSALTVVNAGQLGGNTTGSGAAGVLLGAGGSVTNESGGTISGYDGVEAVTIAATVVNAGVIAGNYTSNYQNADGVYLGAGGSVTNQSGGNIYGRNDGVQITGGRGTVVNLGSIHSRINATYGGRGVSLDAGGLIVNGASGGTASTAFIGGYNYAVQFGATGTDTLMNYGTVSGLPGTVAVSLTTGTIINGPSGATGALIEGGEQASAVLISGAGTVINDATISSYTPHYATNIGFGVSLGGGGTISNLGSLSLIEAYVPVYAGQGATVINAGTIESHYGPGTGAFAVVFGGGTNRLIVDPGAVFVGTVHGSGPVTASVAQYPGATSFTTTTLASAVGTATLELASGASAGTMSGLGTKYVGFSAVTIDSGAQWTFAGSNTLAAGVTLTNSGTGTVAGTLVNDGRVTGASNGIAVGATGQLTNSSGGTITATNTAVVLAGGLVSNASGGVIDGAFGIYDKVGAGAGSVVNAGRINATSGDGIVLDAGGAVTNQSGGTIGATGSGNIGAAIVGGGAAVTVNNAGVIEAQGTYSGVRLNGGGLLINQSGATISTDYAGVFLAGAVATVINSGWVQGEAIGVEVADGGIVSNASGGSIFGEAAILGLLHAATVVNAGSLHGLEVGVSLKAGGTLTNQAGGSITGSSDAVLFVAGYTSRLVIDPGAVFSGTVDGGNTIGATHVSTLELASGASTGTLNGFGGQYIDFAQITIDSGAQWNVIGNDSTTALGGATLNGFSYGDTIDVTNFVATSSSFSSNHLTLSSGASTITLDIQGNFITQQFSISGDGTSGTDIILQSPTLDYGATLDEAGIVATSETVNAGVMTLFNSGHTAVGTVGVGTSLNSGDFLVSNNGTNTTLVLDTVFGTYTSGVTLLTNPTTIASSAKVTGSLASATGVYGPSGTAWTVTNLGTVSETGTASIGVSLASGGTITNAASAVISAGAAGIYLHSGTGSVSNAGSIAGTGTSGFGVRFGSASSGGSVSNQSGGVITGATDGVYFNTGSGAGTVSNAGTITGGTSGFAAINLSGGGFVSNTSGGTIAGHQAGVFIANGTGATVGNAGSIGAQSYGIWLLNGGTVTNASGGRITGSYVTTDAAGVYLGSGGSVTNQSGGIIGGLRGVYVQGGVATVVNAGHIVGSNTTIGAGAAATGAGMYLGAGGSVTNQSGGTISGFEGVYANNVAATVVNTGSIAGNSATGDSILLKAGGSVTNLSGGVISGFDGVYATAAAASVVNAGAIGGSATNGIGVYLRNAGTITNQSGGTISGGRDAVRLASGFTDLLVIDPGAVFTGTVDGGNTIGAASISTLELASSAAVGTLSGLGTKYVNFASDTVDAGANWIFGGTNTLVTGATLTNSGTLTDTGTLISGGTITGNKLRLNGGAFTNTTSGLVTGSYVYGVQAGGTDTVLNQGTITGSSQFAIYLNAAGNVTNAAGALISGYQGVKLHGVDATLVNQGQITATSSIASYAAYLRNGGLIVNGQAGSGTSTASLQGYYGLTFKTADTTNAYGTLENYGTVIGTGTATSDGALLSNAGTVLNGLSGATAALIEGTRYGVSDGAGVVVNDGTILATGTNSGDYGVAINSGTGSVSNLGTASLIEGYTGVLVALNGTVTNAGTIESNQGSSGTAVHFTGGNARLIDDPGAVFVGSIYGGSGGTAVLELASGSSAGTIIGLGTSVTNFTSLVFDASAQWTVEGNDSANGLGTLGISGFTVGDTIDLTSFTGINRTFASNTLIVGDGVGDYETLHIQGSFSTANFKITDVSGSTDITYENGPSITAGGTVTFIGGGSAVALDSGLSLSDTATTTLVSGTISIGTGFIAGDTLNFTNQDGITGSFNSTTGVLTLTGAASLADYQAALDSITYSFTPGDGDPTGGGGDLSRTIDWIVSDGTVVSDPATTTLDVTHVAPTLTSGGTVTFTGGGSAVALDSTLALSDVDSGGTINSGTVSIAGFVSGDILTADTTGLPGITVSYNASTGVLTLTGADTIADYQAVLRSVEFSTNPTDLDPTGGGGTTSTTIDWSVNDGSTSNGAASGTSTLDLVHVAPTLTSGGTVTFTGGGSAVALDSTLTVSDVDSGGNLTGATISIGGFVSGDELNFTNQNGISGSYNASTGVLTLSGTGTVADYQTALDSITYSVSPSNGDPTGGGSHTSRTISWVVSDGSTSNGISNTGTSTLTDVHVAPTVTAGGTVTFTGGGSAVTLDSTLTVSDVDSSGTLTGATVSIGGFVSGDELNFTNQNGITGSYNASTGVLTLSGTSSLADYQTALDSISYSVSPSNSDPTGGGSHTGRTISWVVSDGSSSNGVSNTGTSALTDVHVAPTVTVGGTVTFTGGGSAVVLDSGIAVTDPDSGGNLTGATISIGTGFLSGDQLDFINQNGITGSYNAAAGVLTLSGTSSIANYDSALASITYGFSPSNGDPTGGGGDTSRAIDWVVSDGATISATGTSAVTDVHVAPTVTSGGTVTFTGGGSAVALDSTLTVSDPDSGGNLTGATVSVGGFVSGDELNFTNQNGITGSYNASTGVLTLSGTATIAQYQAALDAVTYSFNPTNGDPTGGGSHTSRTISWIVGDGSTSNGISNTGTSTLTDVHVGPTVTSGGTVTFTGGGSAVTLDSTLTVSDVDSGGNLTGATVSVGGFVSGDELNFTNQNGISGSYNASTGVLTLSGIATIANYQAALDSITYSFNPTNGDPTGGGGHTSRTIDWVVSDGSTSNGISNTGSSTLAEVHVAPTVTAGGTVTFTGGGSAVTLDSTLAVSDSDSGGNLTGATISVGGFISGDELNFTNQNGITGSYNASTGVLTLSGSSSLANYQAALDSITYGFSPSNGDPTGGGSHTGRTISWVVSDGSTSNGISNTGSSTLAEVHVAPTVTAGGTVTFTGGGSAMTLDSTLTVADVDSTGNLTGATVSVGGFVSGDELNFTSQNGISGSYNASTGVLTLSGTSTIADYQAALDSITYSFNPSNGDPTAGGGHTSRTISWVVNDGNSGNGVSNTGTSTLTDVHAAPTVTSGGTVTFTGGGSAVLVDSTVGVIAPDSGGDISGATISIGAGFISGDTLNFTNELGISGSYNAATGVLTLSGTTTASNYALALESVSFGESPANADPTGGGSDTSRTIAWTVNDGVTISAAGTSTVDTVHVSPTVTSGGTVTFTGGGSAVVLDTTLTVSDPDSAGLLNGGTVSIGGFISGDELNFTNQNGIIGSYNASTGVLTLSGSATLAQYQAALDSVSYSVSPTNGDPTGGGSHTSRTISWVVSDPSTSNGISNTGSSTLAEVHVAPTIVTAGTVVYAAGGPSTVLDASVSVADVDSGGNLTGATVSIGSGFLSGDLLNFTNQNGITGSYNSATGVLTLSGSATIAQYQSALDSITYSFTPSPPAGDPTDGNTDNFRAISWTVSDGSTSNGISASSSSTVHVLKQPPTITGTVAGQATTDEAARDPFSGVTIGDPNTGQTETVTITLSNSANGTLSNLDGGTFNNGTYTITGTTLAVTGALDGLVFTPTAHQVVPGDTVTTTFTIVATDNYGVSATNSTTTVNATAVNDPTTISGTLSNYGVANEGTSTPFAGLTVVDPDVGHTDTVTITLSNPLFGTLSNLDGGVYNNGTYTLTGTPGVVTTAIEGLVLTPGTPSSGVYVTSTTLTLSVVGEGGDPSPVSTLTAAVQQVLGLASVPTNKLSISVSSGGTGLAAAVNGDTNEAVVTAPTGGSNYILPAGYQAEYLGGGANASMTDYTVGNAVLVGNTGADTISAVAANDSLVGGNGNNVFYGGTGSVAVVAGSGNNVLTLAAGSTDTVTLGGGNDTVYTAGAGTISGGTGHNVYDIEAGAGTNVVSSRGADTIFADGNLTQASIGGSGSELVGVGGTVDATITGAGATVAAGGAAMAVTASGGTGSFYDGSVSLDVTDNGSNDTISGGVGAVTVSATTNPLVYGGSGSLLVEGGAGTPTVIGGSGKSSIVGGSGGVIVAGGTGTATVSGSATLYGGAGGAIDYVGGSGGALYEAGAGSETLNASGSSTNNLLFGGAVTGESTSITTGTGHDTVSALAGSVTVTATASPLVYATSGFLEVLGGAGTPTVIGGSGGSSIVGGSGGVIVAGGSGTPTVSGAATLYGAAGGQIDYVGSTGGALFISGSGTETIDAAGSSTNNLFYGNTVASSSQVFIGGSGHDTVILGSDAATVQASGQDLVGAASGTLSFIGGAGASTVYGGSGAASVVGGSGGVTFIEGSGAATLAGTATAYGVAGGVIDYTGSTGGLIYNAGAGSETLLGASASAGTTLWGSALTGTHDDLVGGSGNDVLVAGEGADTLSGGGGANQFDVLAGQAGGMVVITDFNTQDALNLIGYGGNAASAAVQGAVVSGGNTTITLADNTQITFLGVSSLSTLHGHVFST